MVREDKDGDSMKKRLCPGCRQERDASTFVAISKNAMRCAICDERATAAKAKGKVEFAKALAAANRILAEEG